MSSNAQTGSFPLLFLFLFILIFLFDFTTSEMAIFTASILVDFHI